MGGSPTGPAAWPLSPWMATSLGPGPPGSAGLVQTREWSQVGLEWRQGHG